MSTDENKELTDREKILIDEIFTDKPCEVFDLKHKGILGGNKFNYWIDDNNDSHIIFSRKHINWLLDKLKGKNIEIIIKEIK